MSEAITRWWRGGVVYQVYPRSFKDSNGDGVGDLRGLIGKLDYLNDGTPASLGVDAIWLSPFYPSPMADFGYDVSDYCGVDPLFGGLEDFDRLVAAVHDRGMRLIVDWVPNHSSDRHPWFIESRSSKASPKRGWYIWRDPAPGGGPPNNWGSFFGGPAWTLDEATGQYYLHQFMSEQPELDWRNPEVERAMHDTLRFWLKRGVDGFRMDVIGLIIKDEALRDNPSNPDASPALPPNDLFGRLVQKYNMDQDEVHPYLRRISAVLGENEGSCAIGELWGPLDRWIRYYGEDGDELHMPFNFRLMATPWGARAIRASVDEMEAALPPFAWPNYVLGNHDQPRLASRLGGQEAARLAAMLLLTLRGTPTLYYGDELGMPDTPIPPERMVDPQGINLGPARSRDIARSPMQWDGSPGAGFSAAEPWLPLAPDWHERNVAAQSADPRSMLSLYRRLVWTRRRSAALASGGYRPIDSPAEDCFAYLREGGEDRMLVVLNFGERPIEPRFRLPASGRILASTLMDREGSIELDSLELRPREGLLVELDRFQ
jgi:alpha-glucosidase